MKRIIAILLVCMTVLCSCAAGKENTPDVNVHVSEPLLSQMLCTVAFRADDTALAMAFDEVLGQMIADGSVKQMCENYLGCDVSAGLSAQGTFHGEGDDDSLKTVKEAGKIVIGYQESCFPYAWLDANGNAAGLDVSIAREAARRMGLAVEFKEIEWITKDASLTSEKVDAVFSGFAYTEERAQSFNLSRPYAVDSLVLVSPGDEPVDSLSALEGQKVAVRSASVGEELVNGAGVVYERVIDTPSCAYAYYRMKEDKVKAILVEKSFAEYVLTGKLEK